MHSVLVTNHFHNTACSQETREHHRNTTYSCWTDEMWSKYVNHVTVTEMECECGENSDGPTQNQMESLSAESHRTRASLAGGYHMETCLQCKYNSLSSRCNFCRFLLGQCFCLFVTVSRIKKVKIYSTIWGRTIKYAGTIRSRCDASNNPVYKT